MNKEVIKDNFEVFKFWLDGGEVWVKYKSDEKWYLLNHDVFSADKCIYVQDDEYAELRKAQADGKVIQFNTNYNKSYPHWIDVCDQNSKMFTIYTADIMRIKPDEPKFKVGDWVKLPGENYQRIYEVAENSVYISNFGNITTSIGINTNAYSKLELWAPAKGEWCVFWDDCNRTYIVSKFERLVGGVNKYREHIGRSWRNIAPLEFVQALKDKQ